MLPAFTAAFLLGLLCGSLLPYVPVAVGVLLASLAGGSSLFERTGCIESQRAWLLYLSLLSGMLYWSVATPPPSHVHPESSRHEVLRIEIAGRISKPVQHAPGRQTILIEPDGHPSELGRLRLVWREPGRTLYQGDRVSVGAKFHRPSGSLNPGGFNWADHLDHQDIHLVATVTGEAAVQLLESGAETWRWSPWNRLDRWRGMIRDAALHSLRQPGLGIFLGIVIGERGYLQQDLQEWFMVTGTVHLLSISGSHLGLVALIVFWLVRRSLLRLPVPALLGLSRRITPTRLAILLTWPAVALYTLLAGAELATIRSLVMITLGLIAVWLGHERHLHHAMAAAALVIVLHDPRAIFDISFQLSFLSVLMILQTGWWINWWREPALPRGSGLVQTVAGYGRDVLLMSGAVTLASLPLVALYFNQVPWMGMLTNLLAVPFTGAVLVPLGLWASAWTVLTGAPELVMGALLDHLLTWMIQALRWCAEIPGAEWRIPAPSIPAVVLFYVGLCAVCARLAPTRWRIMGGTLVFGLVGWWALLPGMSPDGDRWRVTFLDVGQGDSAVVELPDGQTVLIDGGARYERFDMGRGVVAPFLWNRGIRHLDHVVGTHQQSDHVSGLIWVLRHVSVGQYWGTGVERSEQFVADLNAALIARRLQERIPVRGEDLLPAGPCRFKILNPSGDGRTERPAARQSGTALNNRSIVTRLQCGAHAILFAADIEIAGLQALDEEGRQAVTLLKVPHHGARSSLDRHWLGQIHPQYAVISAGRDNPYGHPVAAVLQAYEDQRVALYRTDQDGAVWITGRLSSPDVHVTRMRELLPQPVNLWSCAWDCERQNWRRLWVQFRERPGLPFIRP
ncbi:MAG TPA: DNA internalization-related competence protein ComEC/Rec2 [Nitrospira sp.]|nr:DNA internalization-related competence protein ComEC/Rec2 [Nitrospira sp.]